MSREQWGNGYATGYKDGETGRKNPKYLFTLDRFGFATGFYIIREYHGERLTVEDFGEYISQYILLGFTYNFDESIEDPSMFKEIERSKIGYHQMFFNKEAAVAFLVKNHEEFEKHRRKNKWQENL